MLAVNNHDIEMLGYLWNRFYFIWELADLDKVVDSLYQAESLDALPVILGSKAFKNIILCLPFEDQIFYLEKILLEKFDKDT